MQRAAAQSDFRHGFRPKGQSSASKAGSPEYLRSPSTPRRGGWRPANLKVSPARSPGASAEVRYWDERRKVQARIVLRRFERSERGINRAGAAAHMADLAAAWQVARRARLCTIALSESAATTTARALAIGS